MTGRELIIYILNNHLEDNEIFQNGILIGYISVSEAANKFNVGEATVKIWYRFGALDGVKIGDTIFIKADAKPDLEDSKLLDIPKETIQNYILSQQQKG